MQQPWYKEGYIPLDNDFDSISDFDMDSLFEDNNGKVDTASNTDLDSSPEEIEGDIDIDDDLFKDAVRHPLKYYLAAAENLFRGQLQQKRYSLRIGSRLDWVKGYHDQYTSINRFVRWLTN